MMSVAILEIIRLGGELPLEVLYRMRMIDSVQLPPRVWKCLCMRIIDIYKMYVLIYNMKHDLDDNRQLAPANSSKEASLQVLTRLQCQVITPKEALKQTRPESHGRREATI